LPDQRPATDDSDTAERAERLASDAELVRASAAGGFTGPGIRRARGLRDRLEDGYYQQEIAEIIGDGATSRTVEGLLRRHREKIDAIREQEGDGDDAPAR